MIEWLNKFTQRMRERNKKSFARSKRRLTDLGAKVKGSYDGFTKDVPVEEVEKDDSFKSKSAQQAAEIRTRIEEGKQKNAQKREARQKRSKERIEKSVQKREEIRARMKLPLTKQAKRFNTIAMFIPAGISMAIVFTKTWPASAMLEWEINKKLPRTEMFVYLELTFVFLVICLPLLQFIKRKMNIVEREQPGDNESEMNS
jgi:hypothetical protein